MSNKTNFISGRFNCREFKKECQFGQRALMGDDSRIKFDVTYPADKVPTEFAKHARIWTPSDGAPMAIVSFKVGQRCRWFGVTADGKSEQIKRPTNTYLDGIDDLNGIRRKFDARILYNVLEGDPAKMEASGLWVDAILIREVDVNPFDDDEDEDADAADTSTAPAAAPTDTTEEDGEGLPF